MSKNVKKKEKTQKDSRQSNLMLFSIFSVVILIGIIIVANILFEKILGDAMKFDFSMTGQNSVSKVTTDYIDSLPADKHIRIVGLMDKPENINGSYLQYVVPYLDQFQAKSGGKVTVEYVNPSKYPSIVKELDPTGVYDLKANTYVINIDNKNTVIEPLTCFSYDSEYLKQGYYLPTANNVEYSFTNAIVNMTSGYTAKAYFVTGLKNDESTQLKAVLDGMGISTADIPSSDSFEIPADCDLLFLNGINADIPERVMIQLKDYITNGGKAIVAVDYSADNANENYNNLNEVLNLMNINIDNDMVVETNESYITSFNNYVGIEALVDIHPDFASFVSATKLATLNPRPVRAFDYNKSYISTSPVLVTSSDAVKASNMDQPGMLNVAMYSTYTGNDNPPEFYVFGTMDFTSDKYISSHGYSDSNVEFLRGCIRSVVKSNTEVEIYSKTMDNYAFDTSMVTTSTISAMIIIFMVAIPLALVIVATIVYNKRKNL